MESPILRQRTDEREHVLILDNRRDESTEYSYKTLKVQIGREADHSKPTIYEVFLTKNYQVLDLLVAFEVYFNLNNLKMFYIDTYNREHIVRRERWIGDFENESSVLLAEEPAKLARGIEKIKK